MSDNIYLHYKVDPKNICPVPQCPFNN